jgi:oligopeptide/dipeptide ABC transporter ATP-binding protein
MSTDANKPLLSVRGLVKKYPLDGRGLLAPRAFLRAVDGVDFDLYPGKTLGLVGESGCGKSTTARMAAGIETPDEGTIVYQGQDLATLSRQEKKKIRTDIQMIFQDSYASLNPRRRVFDILSEPLLYHHRITPAQAPQRVGELLDMVGLPQNAADRYPQSFSGGQRQRISIARALALEPKVLICDEPVSALDVSIQAQILNLLKDLQEQLGISYLFIAHGLGAVHYISDAIAVMYLGKIVESGGEGVFEKPMHPYTQLLLASAPKGDPRQRSLQFVDRGEVPTGGRTGRGCAFADRCPLAGAHCRQASPELKPRLDADGQEHQVACFALENDNG